MVVVNSVTKRAHFVDTVTTVSAFGSGTQHIILWSTPYRGTEGSCVFALA